MNRTGRFLTFTTALLTVVALLAGCPASKSGEVYSRDRSQRVQTIRLGEVVAVREVLIEGTKSGAGAVAGGILGAVTGSLLGDGAGRMVGTAVGGVAGAGAGAVAEEGATRQTGLEITVRLDSGEAVAIVQASDVPFEPGERVKILDNPDGSARVVKL